MPIGLSPACGDDNNGVQIPKTAEAAFRPVLSTTPDLEGFAAMESGHTAIKGDDQVIRITMTPDQCKVVLTNDSTRQLIGRTLSAAGLDIEQYEDGQIVFNLHIRQVFGAKMLNGRAVCEMLQMSPGSLRKLVKTGKLASYKIGRLRRFLLEDVCEYLCRCEEAMGWAEQSEASLLVTVPGNDGLPES